MNAESTVRRGIAYWKVRRKVRSSQLRGLRVLEIDVDLFIPCSWGARKEAWKWSHRSSVPLLPATQTIEPGSKTTQFVAFG
jgi:hypothetical protein